MAGPATFDRPVLRATRCGTAPHVGDPRRRAWRQQHVWDAARLLALAHAEWTCRDCGAADWDTRVEVHHVVPVGPDGYGPGCQHHQTNLRVLCTACHRLTHQRLRAPHGQQLCLVAV